MAPKVTVLDYGAGNVRSAVRALEHVGAEVKLSRDPQDIKEADGLLVPGVGAYAAVMDALKVSGSLRHLGYRIAGGRATMGICVGHQVFFEAGVEHGVRTEGLGEWPGVVERLPAPVVPHMGWNTVQAPDGSRLFEGIEDERFYFVHSYGAQHWSLEPMRPFRAPVVTWCDYGAPFLAAVENGPLSATQFHPEKSGAAGIRLLSNWIGSLPR